MRTCYLILVCVLASGLLFPLTLSAQTKGGACIVAEDYVKSVLNNPGSAKFPAFSQTTEKTGSGKFIVWGKFSAANAFNVKSNMVYKIWLEYLSGDELYKESWKCEKLILEDSDTRKQSVFYPSGQKKEVVNSTNTSPGATVDFLGAKCKVIEQRSEFIRIQTPRKYSKSEIEKGLKSFPYRSQIVYFHTVGSTSRGKEYAQSQNGQLFYF